MTRRLIVRPEAEAEMSDAFDWYEDRSAGLGCKLRLFVQAQEMTEARAILDSLFPV